MNCLDADIIVATKTKKKDQGSENIGGYDHFYTGIPKDRNREYRS